jgi:hypothetical protein
VNRTLPYLFILLTAVPFAGCYSFRGISIPPGAQTFFVQQFDDVSGGPATLSQDFSETLRDKVRTESRLTLRETDPDVIFSGSITRYQVSYVAPQGDNTSASNRLTIDIRTQYTSELDESQNWDRNFTFFLDFERDQDLLSIQDELIEQIFEQLVEDIFQAAFTNW